MAAGGIPILTYHSIDDSGSVISTRPAVFYRQMRYLFNNGYRSISLAETNDYIQKRGAPPDKSFVITFDDGYENVYAEAFPVIEQFGFSATVFLITDYCGKRNDWSGQPASIQLRPLLGWSQIKEMRNYGVEFGAHTATHPDLTRIPTRLAEHEIARSKEQIEDRLGVEAQFFAYPYGKYNSKVREFVERQFLGACSTKLGKAKAGCDPYLLKRVDMYYLAGAGLFSALSTRRLDYYLGLRHGVRVLKEALL